MTGCGIKKINANWLRPFRKIEEDGVYSRIAKSVEEEEIYAMETWVIKNGKEWFCGTRFMKSYEECKDTAQYEVIHPTEHRRILIRRAKVVEQHIIEGRE